MEKLEKLKPAFNKKTEHSAAIQHHSLMVSCVLLASEDWAREHNCRFLLISLLQKWPLSNM